VVSALDFRYEGRSGMCSINMYECMYVGGSTPNPSRRVVSLDMKLYPALSLSTQVCKMGTGNILPGVTLRWTSIPSRGEKQYSQLLHATETRLSSGHVDLFGLCATLPYLIIQLTPLRPQYTPKTQFSFSEIDSFVN